ncbi:hypothetical protein ACFXAE_23015 [Streptomyces sp. NPDC059454]|uniref:hypothetical protein n=1 Tax=Streptomyces sp. NPDC059454 TaxID=3346836 RepID=UPI00367A6107
MKNYPPQFKADAVALYQSRPEATIRQVAAERTRGSLAGAVMHTDHGAQTPAGPSPTPADRPASASR